MPTSVTLDRDVNEEEPFPSWIETDSLELTPIYEARASAVHRLFTSFDAILPTSIQITRMGDTFDLLETATHAWHRGEAAFYLVKSRKTGSLFGLATLQDIDWEQGTLRLAVELAPVEYDAFRLEELVHAACYVAFSLYDFEAVTHVIRVDDEEGERAFSRITETVPVNVEPTDAAIIVEGRGVEANRYTITKEAYEQFRTSELSEE